MAERSEARKREAKLRVKIFDILIFKAKLRFAFFCFASLKIFEILIFDAKLRFAFFASLRSAILGQI